VTWVMVNLVSARLGTVLGSVQDRCTVCAKHNIGLEIFWIKLMELLGDVAHAEYRFGPFHDSVSVGAR
jgi:hypothetical protein